MGTRDVLDIDAIIASNPAINKKQFQDALAASRDLRNLGVESAKYNLQVPYSRTPLRRAAESAKSGMGIKGSR